MTSVAQFLALGDPQLGMGGQSEWIFDLPDEVDAQQAGVLFFRINTNISPRVRMVINDKEILTRHFPEGSIVSYHNRIPERVLQPGQNILLVDTLDNEDGTAAEDANVGHPVVFYHIGIA